MIPVALILLAAAAAPAAAQMVVGDLHQPEVTVDLGVLDSLGPAPTLPQLLLRNQAPPRRGTPATRPAPAKDVALHPPKTKKKAVAETATKPEKPVAARPAAPIAPVAASGGATPREAVTATPLAEATPSQPAPEPTPPAPLAAAPPAKPAAPEPTPTAVPTAPAAKPAATAMPITPTAAPPSPVPATPPLSPATVTAMNTPPSLPPESPVKPTATAAPAPAAGEHTRIIFAGATTDLPDDAKVGLDALARRLADDGHLRLQLAAYAGGSSDQANQARRISLQRALAVRSYLMEHGVANTRMDVRALGNRTEGNDPPDRVDIVMLEH